MVEMTENIRLLVQPVCLRFCLGFDNSPCDMAFVEPPHCWQSILRRQSPPLFLWDMFGVRPTKSQDISTCDTNVRSIKLYLRLFPIKNIYLRAQNN